MASIDLDVSSTISSTGWTGTFPDDIQTSNDVRANGGGSNEFIHNELDDVPGDFGSLNTVTLHVEGRRAVAGGRTLSFTVGLYDSADTLLESFTTADLGTSDVQYDSSAFTRSDAASAINGWRLRVTVNEGAGMPQGDEEAQVDRLWCTIDYNVAGGAAVRRLALLGVG